MAAEMTRSGAIIRRRRPIRAVRSMMKVLRRLRLYAELLLPAAASGDEAPARRCSDRS